MEKQNGEICEEECYIEPPVNVVLTLENSLIQKEKINCSPSFEDGLDPKIENDLRIISCELIQTAGILLRLPQVAMATGQVLLQRFYYSKSFVRHPYDTTAMGCLCLASKIEEAPRRIRDVINVFHHIRQVQSQSRIEPLMLDQNYVSSKTQVIKAERRVLKELGFCVHVKHPHKLITTYLQLLNLEKKRALLQMAWNYMNDSLRTNVFVEYPPETIACACIFLSARKLRISMPSSPKFFELFKIPESDIYNVAKKIMELYKNPKASIEEIEAHVSDLKHKFENERDRKRLAKIHTAVVNNSATNGNGHNRRSGSSQSGSAPENNKSRTKRSRSRSKSRTRSHSKPKSYSRSVSSESSRHKRSKKHRDYRSPNRRNKKTHKNRRNSYTPSPSHNRKSYKELKLRRRRDFRNYDYNSEEESHSKSTYYSYWKKFYNRHG